MAEAQCLFEGGTAGRIIAEDLNAGRTEYPFDPSRSLSHLRLVYALDREGAARLVVHWQGKPVEVVVFEVSEQSITLEPTASPS